MKKISIAFVAFLCFNQIASAQKTAQVKEVLDAEKDFNRVVAQKGIKEGTMAVVDADAIVFKPEPVTAKTFYASSPKIAGKLTAIPKIARISANGDLAFTAGSYAIKDNGTEDSEFGEYLSIWRKDAGGKLKLIFNINMQHPEPKEDQIVDFKEPTITPRINSKDPFNGRNIIITTDKLFNSSLSLSSLSAYKEFITLDGRYYFPGFEPIIGQDKILQFIGNQAINIEALNTGAGRATSGDLAYSYGKAKIKKGEITNNYNYVRIWEPDKSYKWNMLVEIFSPIEK
ncbi:Cif family virulence factor [Mucilaginibacter arboris]|uniref:Nuclear transport factor 2 family protein n=1 Tax=Mucilaginibacter arboris TaxID=2682090 RepID=A0A7K1SWG5_9SPHI|nr:hypothetical protein [Mucilaginibacter arboris]MVN21661.1 hypothetical protein [Mucilaginibacter arboris]